MSYKRLKRLDLDSSVLERLSRQNIHTCKDVVSLHPLELQRILGLAYSDVKNVYQVVCRAAAPVPHNGLSLKTQLDRNHAAFIRTDLSALDRVLQGGLPSKTISEIAGPSGCGKTQFCIVLSVLASLPSEQGGLGGAVIYVDTECAFSPERLVEVAEQRFPDFYHSDETLEQLAANVFIHVESTCASLMKRLENLEEEIISGNVKLLIVDSIASLVRKEFDPRGGPNLAERTQLLTRQAALLKYIAETFNIPVVVTNQITTRFSRQEQCEDQDLDCSVVRSSEDGGYVTAALGTTWSHSVNTRLILQYLDGPRRQVLVAKSPISPFAMFVYTIQASGLVLEDGGADHYAGTDPSLQRIRVRTAVAQDAFTY